MTPYPKSRENTGTQPTLRSLLLYFLRLGALGFGGPIALVGYMQRDLVEDRKWVSREDYLEGLAFSQLCPGPLAAQLAKYLGWVHSGTLGATLTGAAFVLPSFLMVLALASLYVHFGQLAWIQGLFYGIGAAVSAIIVRSAWKLIQKTLGTDYLLWVLFGVLAITTVWTQSEVVWLFLLSGFVAMFVKAPPKLKARPVQAGIVGPGLVTGLLGAASFGTIVSVFLFFLKAGAFVFGSGFGNCAVPLRRRSRQVSLADGTPVSGRSRGRHDHVRVHRLLGRWPTRRVRSRTGCVFAAVSIGDFRRAVLSAVCPEPPSEGFCAGRDGSGSGSDCWCGGHS